MFICIHGNKTLLGYFHWDSGNTFYLGSSYIHIYMQFATYIELFWASLVAQLVKNLPAMRETLVDSWVWRRDRLPHQYSRASLVPQMVRICLQWEKGLGGPGFDRWIRKIPWRRAWQPTLLFLPGESP